MDIKNSSDKKYKILYFCGLTLNIIGFVLIFATLCIFFYQLYSFELSFGLRTIITFFTGSFLILIGSILTRLSTARSGYSLLSRKSKRTISNRIETISTNVVTPTFGIDANGKEYIVCPNCRAKNDPCNRFCSKCGAHFNTNICSKCGNVNDENANFCSKCGQQLSNK